ncbi:MAG TPA: hypothetical protein VGB54_11785 [Allosphingosinicella sp.]|jgi:hypothetical protein
MRYLMLAVLLPVAVGGCATGYATDWFRDRPSIINPQLIRYGMDVQQSRCVSEKLGGRLSRQRLRQFQERAAAVRQGLYDASRFSLRDLQAVASAMPDRSVRLEFDNAAAACGVTQGPVLAAGPAPSTSGAQPTTGPSTGTPSSVATSGGVPVDTTPLTVPSGTASAPPAAAAGAATWLNLGAADSGQSIAIDAMSIQQEGTTRIAWFRMTDPESGTQTNNHYRLRIDCPGRTVQPLALRQTDAATGAQVSMREYSPTEAAPGPAEAGTVLEIAFLSLCT